MLLEIQSKLKKPGILPKLLFSFLILSFVLPTVLSMYDSQPTNDITVATSSNKKLTLSQLHQQYPQAIDQLIKLSQLDQNSAENFLSQILKDKALCDFMDEYKLYPTNDALWTFLRKQARTQYLIQNPDSEPTMAEVNTFLQENIPSDPASRAQFFKDLKYRFAYQQIGLVLHDFAAPLHYSSLSKDFLLSEHNLTQFSAQVKDFHPKKEKLNEEDLRAFYLKHEEQYQSETLANVSYKEFKINSNDIINIFGEEQLRMQLLDYDIEQIHDEDLLEFAKVKLNSYWQKESAEFTDSLLDESETSSIESFLSGLNTESSSLTKYNLNELSDYFGREINQIAWNYFSDSNKVSQSESEPEEHWLIAGERIYLIKFDEIFPAKTLDYEEAYSQLRQDYSHTLAKEKCFQIISTLEDNLQKQTYDKSTLDSHIQIKKLDIALQDTLSSENNKNFEEFKKVLTLTHPGISKEKSTYLTYNKIDDSYHLYAYTPESTTLNFASDKANAEVDKWLQMSTSQNYTSHFQKSVLENYQYQVDKNFFEKLSALTSS